MPIRELPLLDQPVAECCTPLVTTLLPEGDAAVLSERFAALGDPVRLRWSRSSRMPRAARSACVT